MLKFPIPKTQTRMTIKLFPHQERAIDQLKTGSILCGGVGSGKTLTALSYYEKKEYPKKLFVITTAAKRDTLDWERESALVGDFPVTIDSWNNIGKYSKVENAFFIFDEQRVVGAGSWVKAFIKIAKANAWLLLSATPGDTWMDYIPTFVANGFYRNRTDFIRTHVVYSNFTKFPKIDHYVEIGRLLKLRDDITVQMSYKKPTTSESEIVPVDYDKDMFELAKVKRWNPFENRPIKDVGEFCHIMRRVVNQDRSRLAALRGLLMKHHRIIVFYNFNYELDILRELVADPELKVSEYNGHRHDPIPEAMRWAYLVQYTSGSEGWNCIETNAIVFYSQNYSYRIMTQAAGRIDRLNTTYTKLYYYHLRSGASIDMAIYKALANKKNFNESKFVNF